MGKATAPGTEQAWASLLKEQTPATGCWGQGAGRLLHVRHWEALCIHLYSHRKVFTHFTDRKTEAQRSNWLSGTETLCVLGFVCIKALLSGLSKQIIIVIIEAATI